LDLAELLTCLCQGLAIDDDALPGTRGGGDVECADPITVAALVDGAFAIDPATLLGDLVSVI